MSVYLDASVLVSFFGNDDFTPRVEAYLRTRPGPVVVSDFAAAEFASAVSQLVRMGEFDKTSANAVFADFDIWAPRTATLAQATPADIVAATAFLRRLDLNLRSADAINIAIARRVEAGLATFDKKMAASARSLKVAVVDL